MKIVNAFMLLLVGLFCGFSNSMSISKSIPSELIELFNQEYQNQQNYQNQASLSDSGFMPRRSQRSLEDQIRGDSVIHSLPTSQITRMLRVIDQLSEGRVNVRDLDRRDVNSINGLLASYGMLQ